MIKRLLMIFLVTGINLILLVKSSAQPELEINGIIVDKEPIAIVNGEIVREGDIINNDVEVVEITEKYVKVKDGDAILEKRVKSNDSEASGDNLTYKSNSKTHSEDVSEHYINAIDYAQTAEDSFQSYSFEDSAAIRTETLKLYKKALREAQWAILATYGEERKDMTSLVDSCRERISIIEEHKRANPHEDIYEEYVLKAEEYYEKAKSYFEDNKSQAGDQNLMKFIKYSNKILNLQIDDEAKEEVKTEMKSRIRTCNLLRLKAAASSGPRGRNLSDVWHPYKSESELQYGY